MMKYIFTSLLFLFSIFCVAQRPKEIQARIGYGLSVYGTSTYLKYESNGIKIEDDTTGGGATTQVPIELRYEISKYFNAGIDMKFGKYLYDQSDENSGKSNSFRIIGIGMEGNIYSGDNVRVYAGLCLNTGGLEISEIKTNSQETYTETSNWRGNGVKFNIGTCYFIGSGPVAINFNLGYDQHNFKLKDYTSDGENQDLTNFDGSLKVSGVELAIGLIVRIKT